VEDKRDIELVLEPEDEYNHEPDDVSNYNESMYFNLIDHSQKIGGWFRLGNRVNENYAEMTCCIYMPDGRVGFMYKKPEIQTNDVFDAGGMRFEVVEPFKELKLSYEGKVCVLDKPNDMAEPKKAFTENPMVDTKVELTFNGISPMFGGRPVEKSTGKEPTQKMEESFSKAHYEQHISGKGTVEVGDERFELSGLGLRDKSWGARYWQAIAWYRWLPMAFSDDFAMMISLISKDGITASSGGMVLHDDTYHLIRSVEIDSVWDDDWYQKSLKARISTDHRDYEIKGEVESLIPLRNQRTTPDGEQLLTRITEGLTHYECDGLTGWGMSEYLDQIVDGIPIGAV